MLLVEEIFQEVDEVQEQFKSLLKATKAKLSADIYSRRVEQIVIFLKNRKKQRVATALLKVTEKLKLEGKFDSLHALQVGNVHTSRTNILVCHRF